MDDNQDAADLLAALLTADGHEVVTAHDGLGALALVEDAAPDVAVLDLGLPVMDGFELAAPDPRPRAGGEAGA
ncbi:MAG TPA: response regulator, partial [Thermoanaerobaculia bacterium]|nr:response regulator [Thermoanaerobaculia bacterium]